MVEYAPVSSSQKPVLTDIHVYNTTIEVCNTESCFRRIHNTTIEVCNMESCFCQEVS